MNHIQIWLVHFFVFFLSCLPCVYPPDSCGPQNCRKGWTKLKNLVRCHGIRVPNKNEKKMSRSKRPHIEGWPWICVRNIPKYRWTVSIVTFTKAKLELESPVLRFRRSWMELERKERFLGGKRVCERERKSNVSGTTHRMIINFQSTLISCYREHSLVIPFFPHLQSPKWRLLRSDVVQKAVGHMAKCFLDISNTYMVHKIFKPRCFTSLFLFLYTTASIVTDENSLRMSRREDFQISQDSRAWLRNFNAIEWIDEQSLDFQPMLHHCSFIFSYHLLLVVTRQHRHRGGIVRKK